MSDDTTSVTQAATRSQGYALFALVFTYPDADWVAAIRAGELAQRLAELGAVLDVEPRPNRAALSDAGVSDDTLAIEYTRLFDTGPLSLHGGHHHGARMQVMEEVLRFYEHFGIALNRHCNELPDHLISELEFMHFLTHREAVLLASGADAGNYRRAQRDFLTRQLGRWAPQLHGRLVEHKAHPFFIEAARLLATFLASEQERLQTACST